MPTNDFKRSLIVTIGKDESGKDFGIDLSIVKHLLIAGCTGSGKSVLLHKIITTLFSQNSPKNMKFIMADPKRVELPVYNDIPHILLPVAMEPKQIVAALKWAVKEMDRRCEIFNKINCRDFFDYKGVEAMPHIIIVIDEFSDVIQTYPNETEDLVLKIAQMGHVVGIYMILSTSRPSSKIFTNAIRDVIGARIAFQASSIEGSKLVINSDEACNLRGAGDMLFQSGTLKHPIRAQVGYISYEEVKSLCLSSDRN